MQKLYRLLFPFLTCCACGAAASVNEECLCPKCARELEKGHARHFLRDGHHVWTCASYKGAAANLVRRCKFRRDREAGLAMGRRCAAMYRQTGARYDLIAPAPLSNRGLRARGFNQCDLIGRQVARECRVALNPKALYRRREIKTQHDLGFLERFENADHAFAARPEAVRGKAVLFLDDVFTSGATSDDCVRALREAGASRVDVLCFAYAEPPRAQEQGEDQP